MKKRREGRESKYHRVERWCKTGGWEERKIAKGIVNLAGVPLHGKPG